MPAPLMSPLLVAALAVLLGSLLDVVVKHAASHYALFGLLFWRFLSAGLAMAGVYRLRGRPWLDARGTRFHLLRGLVHAGAAGLFFKGLTLVSLAEATVLGFTAVLMIPFLGRVFLGERLRVLALAAAGIGFVGVVIITQGTPNIAAADSGQIVEGRLYCLAASLCYALSLIMLRARAQIDDGLTVAVYANLGPALYFAIPGLVLSPPLPLVAVPWVLIFTVIGTTVWVLMTWAYKHAPAQRIGPMEYSALLWAAGFGYVFFGEIPALSVWVGAVFIIGAALVLVLDERRAKPAATSALIGDGAD